MTTIFKCHGPLPHGTVSLKNAYSCVATCVSSIPHGLEGPRRFAEAKRFFHTRLWRSFGWVKTVHGLPIMQPVILNTCVIPLFLSLHGVKQQKSKSSTMRARTFVAINCWKFGAMQIQWNMTASSSSTVPCRPSARWRFWLFLLCKVCTPFSFHSARSSKFYSRSNVLW